MGIQAPEKCNTYNAVSGYFQDRARQKNSTLGMLEIHWQPPASGRNAFWAVYIETASGAATSRDAICAALTFASAQ
jgi:hypothetical protein